MVGEVGGNLGESHARRASQERNLDELHVTAFSFFNFTKLATSIRIIRAYIH